MNGGVRLNIFGKNIQILTKWGDFYLALKIALVIYKNK